MDRIEAIRLFMRVVDSGSFAAAGREAGIGQPAVSKQMAALEQHFGTQLMRRTSRSMTLTADGQAVYDAGARLVGDFDGLAASIGRGQAAVAGLVRMTVAPMFGRLYVVPALPAFFAQYPDVGIDLAAATHAANLVEEGYDLVIRNGDPADANLVARRLASSAMALVATPAYLDRAGTPRSLGDLAGHNGVLFAPAHAVRGWTFRDGARNVQHLPQGPFRSGDAELVRAAVLADMGLAQAPAWMFAAELASGAVVEVLAQVAPPALGIYAIHAAGRRVPSKVRVLIAYLAAAFAQQALPAFLPQAGAVAARAR